MTYARLEEHQGIQWPCPSTEELEPTYLHGRLWDPDPARRGPRAPFGLVRHDPPVDLTDEEYPIRLTTGRRLDSYNTGVQSGGYASPCGAASPSSCARRTPSATGWPSARRCG